MVKGELFPCKKTKNSTIFGNILASFGMVFVYFQGLKQQ